MSSRAAAAHRSASSLTQRVGRQESLAPPCGGLQEVAAGGCCLAARCTVLHPRLTRRRAQFERVGLTLWKDLEPSYEQLNGAGEKAHALCVSVSALAPTDSSTLAGAAADTRPFSAGYLTQLWHLVAREWVLTVRNPALTTIPFIRGTCALDRLLTPRSTHAAARRRAASLFGVLIGSIFYQMGHTLADSFSRSGLRAPLLCYPPRPTSLRAQGSCFSLPQT
jgi:hypothetical protein